MIIGNKLIKQMKTQLKNKENIEIKLFLNQFCMLLI